MGSSQYHVTTGSPKVNYQFDPYSDTKLLKRYGWGQKYLSAQDQKTSIHPARDLVLTAGHKERRQMHRDKNVYSRFKIIILRMLG